MLIVLESDKTTLEVGTQEQVNIGYVTIKETSPSINFMLFQKIWRQSMNVKSTTTYAINELRTTRNIILENFRTTT
jgi:hypothetical protein